MIVQGDRALERGFGEAQRRATLAVRLAELHGTELTVDRSTFRVIFPKDEP